MTDIKKLDDYNHVRLRTEMYFGSRAPHTQTVLLFTETGIPYLEEITWVPALYTCFREILDNSCDEVIGFKHGNKIDITFNESNLEFSVEDNGHGIPIDWDDDYKLHKATMALSEARTGRNFGERGEVAGLNGIGASGVNFCSQWFHIEIHRNNKKFTQEFSEGNAVFPGLNINDPIIKDIKSEKTGTKISFKLSEEIFSNRILPTKFIWSRLYEIAIQNPHVKFSFNGQNIKIKPNHEKIIFEKFIPINIIENDYISTFLLVPNFSSENEHFHSIVNRIFTYNGGNHIDSFKRYFMSGLLSALEKENKKRGLIPNRTDILDKLLIYNVTTCKAPHFDGQAKTRLTTEEAGEITKKNLSNDQLYKDLIKKNKDWIDEIYKRCAERTNKKELDEINKENKKLKKNKVAKLVEATSLNRNECILLLTEGDSAVGEMRSSRNPNIHAGFPLRGKILNVNGENLKVVIQNDTLKDLMSVVGLTLGVKANRKILNYGQIWIAHDMDEDGKNIGALLVNFFYTYWKELFDPNEKPFIYIFNTPFIIAERGKERKYWYAQNYKEFNPETYKGWTITRAKGLGSLMKEDWTHSLKNPNLIPLLDDGKLQESLDLVFSNSRADDRKKWIAL